MPRVEPDEPMAATDAEPLVALRVPQLRILEVLNGEDPDNPPLLSRVKICQRAGFSEISGTITSALNGVPPNSSSGPARPGLVELGMVTKETIDVDGEEELVFRITPAGRAALAAFFDAGGTLPKHRDKKSSTNLRYKEDGDAAS
jgi:hypothetical protein